MIFQPAEEGGGGGREMVEDGLMDRWSIDEVYGMHNMPGLAVGAFAMRTGATMASEALFEITIEGRGGHAAMPHHGVDAITVGSEIVTALQTIVSRKLDPGLNGVVSVTDFRTDGQRNVLPGRATLTGDARALSVEVNSEIERKMRQIVEGVCMAHGVRGAVRYETEFEVLLNAPEPVRLAAEAATMIAGSAGVNTDYPPVMASEDFAHMAKARPGCFVFAGNGVTGPHARPLHSADYDFNDDLLAPGSSFWVRLVEQTLSRDAA
ncbi:MAG: amidohydrolase [Pseudomonadota bacterium]